MLRNTLHCLRKWIPHIEKHYHREFLTHFQSNRICGFYNRHQQSSRFIRENLTPWTARVAKRCVLVVIGTCVGMKIWLVTSDCQEAQTTPHQTPPDPPTTERRRKMGQTLEDAISRSKDILQMIKDETGSPGIVVAVSVDGEQIWSQGLGYSDVENRVLCTPDTVMRIASISKPITTTIVGKLMEEGLLDIDKPVQAYVPKFPEKTFSGEKVTMTTRHVLTQLSGIRHYSKDYMKPKGKKDGDNIKSSEKSSDKETRSGDKSGAPENDVFEMYLKKHFNSVEESLNLFKDDPLVHKPGTKFLYSSHGYTLLSAVLEGATTKTFKDLLLGLFKDLGLRHTYLDENAPLIYNRSRNYVKTSKGRLANAPYVDCSYKWAGGGLLSTVGDLVKFGNVMLYSYQFKPPRQDDAIQSTPPKQDPSSQSEPPKQGLAKTDSEKVVKEKSKDAKEAANEKIAKKDDFDQNKGLRGYLKRETIQKLWHIEDTLRCSWDNDAGYGLGWVVVPEKIEHGYCRHQRYHVSHTGGAMGASSVLIIVPCPKGDNPPSGVVVAIIANMMSVGLMKTALKIAQEFENI